MADETPVKPRMLEYEMRDKGYPVEAIVQILELQMENAALQEENTTLRAEKLEVEKDRDSYRKQVADVLTYNDEVRSQIVEHLLKTYPNCVIAAGCDTAYGEATTKD